MISLSILERRLAVLERPYNADLDLEKCAINALEALNDTELGLLDEFYSLLQSGFSFDKISSMMGEESYQAAIAAIEKADREYKRLIEEARPKRQAAPLEQRREPERDECHDA
jgi:GTP1/Obg family GTP-binding protein